MGYRLVVSGAITTATIAALVGAVNAAGTAEVTITVCGRGTAGNRNTCEVFAEEIGLLDDERNFARMLKADPAQPVHVPGKRELLRLHAIDRGPAPPYRRRFTPRLLDAGDDIRRRFPRRLN